MWIHDEDGGEDAAVGEDDDGGDDEVLDRRSAFMSFPLTYPETPTTHPTALPSASATTPPGPASLPPSPRHRRISPPAYARPQPRALLRHSTVRFGFSL